MKYIIAIYLHFFHFISKERMEKKDTQPRRIHYHLLATISTAPLMWGYAICAHLTIASSIPYIVGYTTAIVHLLSPILFKFTSNVLFVSLCMLIPGFTHQGTYSFFTGGFSSNILIWYGIIPMLAGVIEGYRGTVITSIMVTIIAGVFFYLEFIGFNFPDLITEKGRLFSHFSLVFGWIGVSTGLMFMFNKLTDSYEQNLTEQKNKTDTLLKILLHDISNSVQIIYNANQLLRGRSSGEMELMIQDKITNSSHHLIDVINSVKDMHVLETEKREMKLEKIDPYTSITKVSKMLDSKLKSKNISLYINNTDCFALCDQRILENQILTNILTNCIKFTPKDKSIYCDIYPLEQDYITIKITDEGIGIPQDILENLFNPQAHTHRPGTNKEKGTGFGMIIMKAMTEKMNGKIDIISDTKGQKTGTQFKLYLKKAI